MGGSTVSLIGKTTFFSADFFQTLPKYFDSIIIGGITIIFITVLVMLFLETDLGQAFIVTGDNRMMARSQGINTDNMTILGLTISNGLVGLCGALISQSNGYADANMGIGIIVGALASIIIGEVVFGEWTLNQRLVAVTLGSIIYRFVLLLVLQLGFSTNDLNLISAIILAFSMMLPNLRSSLHLNGILRKGLSTNDKQ